MIESHEQSRRDRLAHAYQSLEGLHCGDAFGERFFVREQLALSLIRKKAVPGGWCCGPAAAEPPQRSASKKDHGNRRRAAL
jgi:hypothetical protein